MARNPLSPFLPGGIAERGFGEDPFLSLHREMNRLFDDALRGLPSGTRGREGTAVVPAHMDVSETEGEVRICAELPGVKEEDVDVSLENDVLTIRGEKRLERTDEKETFHFMERSYGTFRRSLRLPFPVEPDQVRAEFNNGVLTVTLPKSRTQERSRRIQIQGGGQRRVEGGGGEPPSRAPDKKRAGKDDRTT